MDQTAPSVPATVPDAPRVFATCLYHYNCGDLVGNWFDAQGAEEVTLADVHRGQAPVTPECEEIAVFDADCMLLGSLVRRQRLQVVGDKICLDCPSRIESAAGIESVAASAMRLAQASAAVDCALDAFGVQP